MGNSIIKDAELHGGVITSGLPGTNLMIKVNGEWQGITEKRYKRINEVAEYYAKGYNSVEISEKMGDSVHQDIVRTDIKLIKEMDVYPLSEDTMQTIITQFLRSAHQAKKRFWEIADREFNEDGNPFAAIKAARHAFTTDKEILQLMSDLGFKAQELAQRSQSQDAPHKDAELDSAIEKKLNDLGIEDLGELDG